MNKNKRESEELEGDLRPEYDVDYSKATWGKYHKRLLAETGHAKTKQGTFHKDSEAFLKSLE